MVKTLVQELQEAHNKCIKISQRAQFDEEIFALEKGQNIVKGSLLFKLNSFLDKEGILRAGGRLHNSNLSFNEKHPPILMGNSHLGKLIV